MIETERLNLIPLSCKQLDLLVHNLSAFEKAFGYPYKGEELTGKLYKVFENQISVVEEKGPEYIWCTFWLMINKQEQAIIGSFSFKAVPDKNGIVEVGYGINPNYGKRGYTTEALKGAIEWAFAQPKVTKVIAEVDKENIASQRVLQKCCMIRFKEVNEYDWYFIERDNCIK